jgi:abequosyltransferase
MLVVNDKAERVKPLLTIAIPTYNRAPLLSQSLAVLSVQLQEFPDVELIVSDNASTDETKKVVSEHLERGVNLRYVQNESNFGMDRNFQQCFQFAQGKYFWLLSDDDIALPGSIALIRNYLLKNEYDLVFMEHFVAGEYSLPYRQVDGDRLVSKVSADPIAFSHWVNLRGDLVYITAFIVNKDRLGITAESLQKLVGTFILQLGWIMTSLNQFSKGLLISKGLVLGGTDVPKGGFSAGKVFGQNYARVISEYLPTNRALSKSLIDDLLTIWFPRNWLYFRRGVQRIEANDPHLYLKPIFGPNIRYWIFAFPLFRLPLVLARIYKRLIQPFSYIGNTLKMRALSRG